MRADRSILDTPVAPPRRPPAVVPHPAQRCKVDSTLTTSVWGTSAYFAACRADQRHPGKGFELDDVHRRGAARRGHAAGALAVAESANMLSGKSSWPPRLPGTRSVRGSDYAWGRSISARAGIPARRSALFGGGGRVWWFRQQCMHALGIAGTQAAADGRPVRRHGQGARGAPRRRALRKLLARDGFTGITNVFAPYGGFCTTFRARTTLQLMSSAGLASGSRRSISLCSIPASAATTRRSTRSATFGAGAPSRWRNSTKSWCTLRR